MAETQDRPTDLDYAHTLWKAADALRGQVDAAEYKHVVLGQRLLDLHVPGHRLMLDAIIGRILTHVVVRW